MARTTIQEVAKEAGVSITTVSRVMNGNYPVKAATKEKVERAVKKLAYKPNLLAKSLIQNATKTIGILTPSLENLFFSEVITGIDQILRPKGYTTFLCNTEGDPEGEREMIESLKDRQVDGIVMIDPRQENGLSGYLDQISGEVPLMLINGDPSGVACNYILNDAQSGVIAALKYLREQGPGPIAFLRGKNSYSYDIKEEIYLKYCQQEQLEPMIIRIKEGNDISTVNKATQAINDLLQDKEVSGIFACNDWMAVGALNGAKAMEVAVPDQLHIVGFDNTIISQITSPKLSTVDQQMTQLGRLAAKRILNMLEEAEPTYQKIYLETKLIIRET